MGNFKIYFTFVLSLPPFQKLVATILLPVSPRDKNFMNIALFPSNLPQPIKPRRHSGDWRWINHTCSCPGGSEVRQHEPIEKIRRVFHLIRLTKHCRPRQLEAVADRKSVV